MSTMTGSFGAVAQNMSVQRLYEKALDQIMVSPTPLWQFYHGANHRRKPARHLLGSNDSATYLPLKNGDLFGTAGLF